jgi:hypothetical protein
MSFAYQLNETSIIIGEKQIYTIYPNGNKSITPVYRIKPELLELLPTVTLGSDLEDSILITRLLENTISYQVLLDLIKIEKYEPFLK